MGDSGDMSGRHAFVASVPFTLMEPIHFTSIPLQLKNVLKSLFKGKNLLKN